MDVLSFHVAKRQDLFSWVFVSYTSAESRFLFFYPPTTFTTSVKYLHIFDARTHMPARTHQGRRTGRQAGRQVSKKGMQAGTHQGRQEGRHTHSHARTHLVATKLKRWLEALLQPSIVALESTGPAQEMSDDESCDITVMMSDDESCDITVMNIASRQTHQYLPAIIPTSSLCLPSLCLPSLCLASLCPAPIHAYGAYQRADRPAPLRRLSLGTAASRTIGQ